MWGIPHISVGKDLYDVTCTTEPLTEVNKSTSSLDERDGTGDYVTLGNSRYSYVVDVNRVPYRLKKVPDGTEGP